MEAAMTHKVAVFGCGCESRVVPGSLVVSNNDIVEITGIDSKIEADIHLALSHRAFLFCYGRE